MDKTGRNGLRVGDLELSDWKEKYRALANKHQSMISFYNVEIEYDLEEDLEILKTYYWKIVPLDSQGNTNNSIVWSFKTGENFPLEGN